MPTTSTAGRYDQGRSLTAMRPAVPAGSGPGTPDQTADGDDGAGEAEESVDDGGAPLMAAGEPVEADGTRIIPPGADAEARYRAHDKRTWTNAPPAVDLWLAS